MAGTKKPLHIFLIIHKAPEMSADAGKYNIPLVRPVDDDGRSVVKNNLFRLTDGNFCFAEDKPSCPGFPGRRREIFEKGIKEGSEGRQTQDCKCFL